MNTSSCERGVASVQHPAFVGMVTVACSDGREFVGDLWRYPDGRLELEPPGESPYVVQFLDAVSIRLLNEAERQQVTVHSRMHRQRRVQQRHGVKRSPASPDASPPACLPLEFILRKQVNIDT